MRKGSFRPGSRAYAAAGRTVAKAITQRAQERARTTGGPRPRLSDHSGISLRPDLYEADRAWLATTAEDEARALLAESEGRPEACPFTDHLCVGWIGAAPLTHHEDADTLTRMGAALAESLARFIGGEEE